MIQISSQERINEADYKKRTSLSVSQSPEKIFVDITSQIVTDIVEKLINDISTLQIQIKDFVIPLCQEEFADIFASGVHPRVCSGADSDTRRVADRRKIDTLWQSLIQTCIHELITK